MDAAKERLGRGGNEGQVRADAKQGGLWRKAPVGDTYVQELSLQVQGVKLDPLST